MISGTLAKRYARALLDCASDGAARDRFDRDLDAIARAFALPDELGVVVAQILASTRYPLDQRKGLARALVQRVGADATVGRFIELLVERGRVVGIDAISRAFRALADERANRVRATLTSAKPLPPASRDEITKALERSTGRTVLVATAVDPDLLGGVVAEVGGFVIDRSLRTQLEQLRGRLAPE